MTLSISGTHDALKHMLLQAIPGAQLHMTRNDRDDSYDLYVVVRDPSEEPLANELMGVLLKQVEGRGGYPLMRVNIHITSVRQSDFLETLTEEEKVVRLKSLVAARWKDG